MKSLEFGLLDLQAGGRADGVKAGFTWRTYLRLVWGSGYRGQGKGGKGVMMMLAISKLSQAPRIDT